MGSVTEPNQSISFYLILTAANEIYDDFGEEVSLDKIKNAVIMHASFVTPVEQNQTDMDIIDQFKKSEDAAFHAAATLVCIQNRTPSKTFNPRAFFVASYTNFATKGKQIETVKINPDEPTACIIS